MQPDEEPQAGPEQRPEQTALKRRHEDAQHGAAEEALPAIHVHHGEGAHHRAEAGFAHLAANAGWKVAAIEAEKIGGLRVIDEDGEDYLYDSEMFYPLQVPPIVAQTLISASKQG